MSAESVRNAVTHAADTSGAATAEAPGVRVSLPVLGASGGEKASLVGDDLGPFPEPPLYESYRNGKALVIDPPTGRWWVGSEKRIEIGREKVQQSAPHDPAEDTSYEDYPAMLAVVKNKDCNLGCTYCFAEADLNRAYHTGDQLRRLFHRILESFPNKKTIVFLFSGGEPLLHFKTIREGVQRFWAELDQTQRERVVFGLMSNGTPITREMVEFFREYDVNVCVSIDGPAHLHDRNRPLLANGQGSHAKVESKLDLLTEYGVAYSTICTIVNPEDLFPAFEYQLSRGRRNLYMRPLRMQGRQLESDGTESPEAAYFDTQHEMAEQFLQLADRIAAYNRVHEDRIVEQTIANHVRHLISPAKTFMCLKGPCGAGSGAKLGVDWNGNLYPCDTLVEFPELQIASAQQVEAAEDFSQVFKQSDVLGHMSGRRPQNIRECSQCQVQKYCGGGCTATSYSLYGDLRSPSDRCDYERAFFEGLLWRFFESPDTAPLLLGHQPGAQRQQWSRPSVMELCTENAV